jgi:hypothetical protein
LFGTALYEDIACMIYDLIDSKRQHSNYLQNLKLIHVPVFGQPSFSFIMAVSVIGGGNQSSWRKPLTCRMSLTISIT